MVTSVEVASNESISSPLQNIVEDSQVVSDVFVGGAAFEIDAYNCEGLTLSQLYSNCSGFAGIKPWDDNFAGSVGYIVPHEDGCSSTALGFILSEGLVSDDIDVVFAGYVGFTDEGDVRVVILHKYVE